MSGIVAVLNTNGALCDTQRLRQLTQALEFRGPDGNATKALGQAGLGATLLRTTDESANERQPLSLDGAVWIVADCRVDDRATLVAALRGAGEQAPTGAPDVELILRAYHAWGTRCVQRLIGDFAFVIWDGRDRTLFAARDHFGVKPFFYAQVGALLILSNTLGCIRQHPDVPAEVNEAAIGDFLLWGGIYYPAITAFRHIQRLPEAHTLRSRDGHVRVERYWQAPEYEEPLRLRRREIFERLQEVMRAAVSDRLRVRAAAVDLSGGVDSTSVAATAFDLQQRNMVDVSLTAWTFDGRPLVANDPECDLARLTASALRLVHRSQSYEGYTLFRDTAGQYVLPLQEPYDLSLAAADRDFTSAIARSCRVRLTGQGGDAVFRIQAPRRSDLLPLGWLTVAGDGVSYLLRRREPPPLGVRSALRWLAGMSHRPGPPFPEWIAPDFARRQCLEDRWRAPRPEIGRNVLRPNATQLLRKPWAPMFEGYDPEWTRVPLETRHPLLDLRLIDFLLQVPGVPWFWHKDLPRRACLGPVPSKIRNRRKTPLVSDPLLAALERGDRLPDWQSQPSVHNYVRCERIPKTSAFTSEADATSHWTATYPVSLSLWLQSLATRDAHAEQARTPAHVE